MFTSLKQRILLGVFIVLILSIPIGAYVLSQRPTSSSSPTPKPGPVTTEPKKEATRASQIRDASAAGPKDDLSSQSTPSAVSFGPTMNLKLILEGRPASDQSSSIFIGIAEGIPATSPKYLLSFTITLPLSGVFDGLSLAGLNPGIQYSAFIKGPAQIATSSAFVMSPSVTNLNSGNPLTLLTGDLNEDNVINSADFAIARAALGANQKSANWNANIDFNKDGVVNSLDIGFIIKNFAKAGASGAWVSATPKVATQSGSVATSSGMPMPVAPSGQTSGYWLWVPGF